jgi:hypothetical protein
VDTLLAWGILAYIVMDTAYNCLAPQIQPSTGRLITIVVHHIATAWLVLYPIRNPHHMHLGAHSAVVEVNTLLLTMGKLGMKSNAQQMGFYLTWVTMRLMWYPVLCYRFHYLGHPVGSYEYCQIVGSQVVLTCLGYYWSFELVWQMRKKSRYKS